MDNLDFLDGQEPEPAAAPTLPVSEPISEAPVRDDQGRFAPKEPAAPAEPVAPLQQPETQAAPEPALQAPQAPPPGYVPVDVVKELRAEIKALKHPPQAPPPPPDRYDDPDGYEAYQSAQLNERLLQHTLNTSERFARKEHGVETVEKARDWALGKFQSDPLYYQRVMSDPDPYELVVQEFKREQVFSQLQGSDLDAFLTWKAQQAPPSPHQQIASQVVIPPISTPPRSLASEPSAGGGKPGEQPVGPGVAFDAIFGS